MVTTPEDLTGTARPRSRRWTPQPVTSWACTRFCGPDAVDAAVAAARDAQAGPCWGSAGGAPACWPGSTRSWTGADELAGLVRRETGKPADDALLEIMLAAEHLDWAARKEAKVLSPRRVPSGPPMLNQAASLSYVPLGVVGLIGPWNYPVFTPMGSIAYALAARNAVVFKPSEYTPGVGGWLAENFASAVGEAALFSVVTGDAAPAARCPEPGWTSSPLRDGAHRPRGDGGLRGDARAGAAGVRRQGRAHRGRRRRRRGPGGAVGRAVQRRSDLRGRGAGVRGRRRARRVPRPARRARPSDRPGADEQASYGPITMPAQVELIRRHIADALARGAQAVVGGPDAVRGANADPVVLTDVPEDALALREETFGPTLTVAPGARWRGGVDRTYDSAYALASAVLSRRRGTQLRTPAAGGHDLRERQSSPSPRCRTCGVGESGFGRIHGADCLREFTRAKAVTRQRFASPLDLTSLSRSPRTVAAAMRILRLRHGRR